jgi:hypothetical protein
MSDELIRRVSAMIGAYLDDVDDIDDVDTDDLAEQIVTPLMIAYGPRPAAKPEPCSHTGPGTPCDWNICRLGGTAGMELNV